CLPSFTVFPYTTLFRSYKGIYEAMRKNIYEHSYYLFFENFVELDNMDYVFICIDDNEVRAQLVRYLIEKQISFIDVGLGVNTVEDRKSTRLNSSHVKIS